MEDVFKLRWWIIFIATEAVAAGVLWLIGLLSPWMLIISGAAILLGLVAFDHGESLSPGKIGRFIKWGGPPLLFFAVVVVAVGFAWSEGKISFQKAAAVAQHSKPKRNPLDYTVRVSCRPEPLPKDVPPRWLNQLILTRAMDGGVLISGAPMLIMQADPLNPGQDVELCIIRNYGESAILEIRVTFDVYFSRVDQPERPCELSHCAGVTLHNKQDLEFGPRGQPEIDIYVQGASEGDDIMMRIPDTAEVQSSDGSWHTVKLIPPEYYMVMVYNPIAKRHVGGSSSHRLRANTGPKKRR